jgi:AcrR family transcriptional regulator
MADNPPRPYRSGIRAEGQRLTVRRCVEAAAELFTAQGYAATTIDAIADRAGVARRTVYSAVGGKVALLKLAYDWSLVGDDEPIPMSDRPEIRAISATRSPRRAITLWAEHVTAVAHRSTPMLLVMRAAADTDPDAAALYEKAMRDARLGAAMFVEHLTTITTLQPGLDTDRAADLIWALLDPGVYDRMVRRGGWNDAEFSSWLATVFSHGILPPAGRRTSTPPHPARDPGK